MHSQRFITAVLCTIPLIARAVDFGTQVHPILVTRCSPCHGGSKPAAGLSLETRPQALAGGISGPAIVPGKGEGSLLILRVSGKNGALMPATGARLSEQEVTILRAWIDEGAVWPENTGAATNSSLPPILPRRPGLPPGREPHPVDRFIAAYFAKHGMSFSEQTGDAAFARRVYYDLWGLPPAPERLQEFLRDQRPDKRGRLINELLAEPALYAGNWISWWNDLLRNDTGVNYQGERKPITEWLLNALERNMPYDRMISALVNPVAKGDPEGFLIGVNWRGDVNASQTPYMQAAQNTAQVFLGINLKCASCHDSFINRYKLRESYGMAALFSNDPRLELVRCDVKTGQFTGPQLLYPGFGALPEDATLAERHAAAARFFADPRNGRVPRTIVNRYWQKLFGRGLVEPVDDMDSEPWYPDLLDWLASDFTAHGNDLHHLLRLLMTSKAYQLSAAATIEQPAKAYVFRGPLVRRLSADQFADTVSAVTGEWRVLQKPEKKEVSPARDWQFKASPLALAMGRPIRDQVFTTRDNRPTTFQALELVNGSTLGNLLRRGSLRLLSRLPPAPQNLFDSGNIRKGAVDFDINISGIDRLWLLAEDAGSYDPARTIGGWAEVELSGPRGSKTLAELAPGGWLRQLLTAGKRPVGEAVTAPPGTRMLLSLAGLGFTRMRGRVALDDRSLPGDIEGALRFFIFAAEPDPERLARVSGEPPVPAPAPFSSVDEAIRWLYLNLLAREPGPREIGVARSYFPGGRLEPAALEDFLWSLLLHPECQYLY